MHIISAVVLYLLELLTSFILLTLFKYKKNKFKTAAILSLFPSLFLFLGLTTGLLLAKNDSFVIKEIFISVPITVLGSALALSYFSKKYMQLSKKQTIIMNSVLTSMATILLAIIIIILMLLYVVVFS